MGMADNSEAVQEEGPVSNEAEKDIGASDAGNIPMATSSLQSPLGVLDEREERDDATHRRLTSGERINYTFRPAKYIERKMMAEVFRRVPRGFGSLRAYRYVGFGSFYFRDFFLFHKQLEIESMISVEYDEDNERRFEFNKPSNYVSIKYGRSNEVLPILSWKDERTIFWLDYDYHLDETVLADVQTVCGQAEPGSILVISVNANAYKLSSAEIKKHMNLGEVRLRRLRERLGRGNVPNEISPDRLPKGLDQWWDAMAYRSIITAQIEETLMGRNSGRSDAKHVKCRQLFNFHYSDGAQMLTVGGILYEHAQMGQVGSCNFEELDFVSSDTKAIEIRVPILTYREVRFLESQFPLDDYAGIENSTGIPKSQIEAFKQVYRYFPSFMETDV